MAWKYLGSNCPVCNGERRDCRQNTDNDLIHCRSTTANPPGLHFIGEDAIGFAMWGQEPKRGAEYRDYQPKRKISIPKPKIADKLPVNERDSAMRAIARHGGIDKATRQKLHERGLDDPAIERLHKQGFLFRWPGGETVEGVDKNCPGVKADGKVFLSHLPLKDVEGNVVNGLDGRPVFQKIETFAIGLTHYDGSLVASQIKMPGGGYIWGGTAKHGGSSPHYKNELPLQWCGKPISGTLNICEGTLKPLLAKERLGGAWCGASGGQFAGSLGHFKGGIDALGVSKIILWPDGGAIQNPLVMKQYRAIAAQLETWGIDLQVAWYGQISKEDGDVDEVNPVVAKDAELLTWDEFEKVAHANRDHRSMLKKQAPSSDFAMPDEFDYTPRVVGNQKWVSNILTPADFDCAILAMKSPQNTGKTTALEGVIADLHKDDVGVTLISYRQSLELGSARRFNLACKSESRERAHEHACRGRALCIHSLHPDGQAAFDGNTAPTGVVVIDEVVSVLRELTSSSLVDRAKVLGHFVTYLRRCHAAGFPIILMDAHISDLEVRTIADIIGVSGKQVRRIENLYKPWAGRKVEMMPKTDAIELLEKAAADAQFPFLCSSTGQKPGSTYGTIGLESRVLKANPECKTLRIDSATICEPGHDAAIFMGLLESDPPKAFDRLKRFDGVFYSPAIEAGVSLDIFGHFKAQYSFTSGNLLPAAVVQQVLRLRDAAVPMFLGCDDAMAMVLQRGNGATNASQLEESESERARSSLMSLVTSGCRTELLSYYYQDGARINALLPHYRDAIAHHLTELGCDVTLLSGNPEDTKDAVKERANQSKARCVAHAQAVAAANDLDDKEAKKLQDAKFKTQDEQKQLEKYGLGKRYRTEVKPGLAILDELNGQFYKSMQLAYYLSIGREYLTARDQAAIDKLAKRERGEKLFQPDIVKRTLGHKVAVWDLLGLTQLTPGEKLAANDPKIIEIQRKIDDNAELIKTLTGKDSEDKSTVAWINNFARAEIGKSLLVKTNTVGKKGQKRIAVYEVKPIAPDPVLELDQNAIAPQISLDASTDEYKDLASTLIQSWGGHLMAQWYKLDTEAKDKAAVKSKRKKQGAT